MLAIYIRSRRKWKSRRPISDKCTEAEAGLKRSMINAQKHYTLRKNTETGDRQQRQRSRKRSVFLYQQTATTTTIRSTKAEQ